MNRSHHGTSTALVATVIALYFALGDSAVAETDVVASAISAARVRSIARRVANQQITIRAPGLSVGSAVGAQSANTANSANAANFSNSANPVLFARVLSTGQVDAANSKGVGSANVTVPLPGLYCFSGLPAIKGGQVTPDFFESQGDESGQFALGTIAPPCAPATQFFVLIRDPDLPDNVVVPGGFFLHLYQ